VNFIGDVGGQCFFFFFFFFFDGSGRCIFYKRLDQAQLEMPVGDLTVPPKAGPAEQQPAQR
jgi:hypothetical protein